MTNIELEDPMNGSMKANVEVISYKHAQAVRALAALGAFAGFLGWCVHMGLAYSDGDTTRTSHYTSVWWSAFSFLFASFVMYRVQVLAFDQSNLEPRSVASYFLAFLSIWGFVLSWFTFGSYASVKEAACGWAFMTQLWSLLLGFFLYIQFKHSGMLDKKRYDAGSKSCGAKFAIAGQVFLFLALTLIVLTATIQAMSMAVDLNVDYPHDGNIHDGQYIKCSGSGYPVVVFIQGSQMPSFTWDNVWEETTAFTRACTYDRGGYGWSEMQSQPRDARTLAEELHELLRAEGEDGPFVLVPHSFGGQIAWQFAYEYESQVYGMVMIDAQSYWFSVPGVDCATSNAMVDASRAFAPLGFVRFGTQPAMFSSAMRAMSDEWMDQMIALVSTNQAWNAKWGETVAEDTCDQSVEAVQSPFSDIRVSVISAGVSINATCYNYDIDDSACSKHEDMVEDIKGVMAAQARWEASDAVSPLTRWTICSDCQHEVMLDNPQLVVSEINLIVQDYNALTPANFNFVPRVSQASFEVVCRTERDGPESWCSTSRCDWCDHPDLCRLQYPLADISPDTPIVCEDINEVWLPQCWPCTNHDDCNDC